MGRTGGGARIGGGGFGGGMRSFSMPRTVYHPPPVFHHPAPVVHHPAPVFHHQAPVVHHPAPTVYHQPAHTTFVNVPVAPTAVFVPVAVGSTSVVSSPTSSSHRVSHNSDDSASSESSSGDRGSSNSGSNRDSYVSTGTAESFSKRTADDSAMMPSAPPFDSVPLGGSMGDNEFIHPPTTTFSPSSSYASQASSDSNYMYADDNCCEPVCCSRFFCVVALLFAIVMTISVAASRYSTAVEVADFEQILASPSTTWRSSIHVVPGDSRSQSFLLSKRPLTKRNDIPRFEQQNLFVQSDSYRYATYRLLKGSRVSMAYNTKGSFAPDFYMIESESLFQKWEDGAKVNAVSIGTSRTGSLLYTVVKEVEELYFVWEAVRQPGNEVYANFTLDLMLYDSVANRLKSCDGICDLELQYASDQVVLVVPFETGDQNHVQTITYTVSPRYGPFAAIGGSISGFFTLVALGFYVQRLLRVRAWKKAREEENENRLDAASVSSTTVFAEKTPGMTLSYPPDVDKI